MGKKHQTPAPHSTSKKEDTPQQQSKDDVKIQVQVLSEAQAKLQTEEAAKFLRAGGFRFNKHENLHKALQPEVNLALALMGDRVQGFILAEQWVNCGGKKTTGFFQQHVFQPVATNKYQARMAVQHGLARFMFTISKAPENKSSQNDRPRYKDFDEKTQADTIEALMGAIYLDGNAKWKTTLERFMRVSDLDFDAAMCYKRRGENQRRRVAGMTGGFSGV